MAADIPRQHYEHFAPPERLTLLIEAMARDDEAEAGRLRRTCPRATYTSEDPEFADRWSMAFDILAVVSIDLRCMWGKLHMLQWVIENVHPVATGHHVTAAFAFLEGERCGRGLKQMGFFAKPLPESGEAVDYSADGEDDGDDEEEVLDPSPGQVDRGVRLNAVEKRAEHFTTCGMVALLCAANAIAKDLVNTWAAFGRFCRTRLGVSPEAMMRAWEFPLEEFEDMLKRYQKVKPQPKTVDEYFGYITKQWDRRFLRPPGSEYLNYGDEGDAHG